MRWERAREAMRDALRRHDVLMRAAISEHGGYVFKTVGDAFCASFWHPEDAVGAMLDAQRALAADDFSAVDGIRVRAAIHTGTADEREGDYFGPTVNRVARLLSIAHGGQVLLSGTAAGLFAEVCPVGVSLIDLGEHYLKDMGRLEHVHQIQAPGLALLFPTLRSAGIIPNNIPEFASTFVGREREVEEIGSRLDSTRGITLCGTGGVGKTRCALQVGKDRIARFLQGVWFVELASITVDGDITGTIAATIGVAESNGANALDALCIRLKNHTALIVLDNCEHLVREVAPVVETLLKRCPDLRILSTSREPIGYRGEVIYRVPSLATPQDSAGVTPETALAYDALALFVVRAKEVDREFRLTGGNLATVVSICQRLDGIALAIELAAMRLRVISLDRLASGLRERFRLLTGGSRTALPRQQTMRAVIDWSYELLDDSERRLFRGLSVFAGGFTIESCAAVCAEEAAANRNILDPLASLVDKSLVAAPSAILARGDCRLSQIETLRDYAAEKLAESGEAAVRFASLARWALELVEKAHAEWVTAATAEWESLFKPEIENIRTAVKWALGPNGDIILGARIVARSRRMLGVLAPVEGLQLIELVQGFDDLPVDVNAELTLGLAQMNIALRRGAAALAYARAASEAFASLGNEEFAGEAQIVSGHAQTLLGHASDAKIELETAQTYFESANLAQFCGVIASDLGAAHVLAEEFVEARASFNKALAVFRRTENERGIRAVVTNLAEMDFYNGEVGSAIDRISAELAGNAGGDALMLSNLSAYLIAAGRLEQALEYGRESLIAAEASHQEAAILLSLQHIATAIALRPREDSRNDDLLSMPARLIGFVDARLASTGSAREYTERQEYERAVLALRQTLGPSTLECLLAEGASWDYRMAIAAAIRT